MPIRSSHRVDAGFSLSSMTDLVFLLLIFFVIVSTMVSPYALPVELPKGRSAATRAEEPKVTLRLESATDIRLNGTPVDTLSLEPALKAEMARHADQEPIIMRVAQEAPTGLMVKALDMAKRNHWHIVLAAAAKPVAPEAPATTPPTTR